MNIDSRAVIEHRIAMEKVRDKLLFSAPKSNHAIETERVEYFVLEELETPCSPGNCPEELLGKNTQI
jgi:hypothetical protein